MGVRFVDSSFLSSPDYQVLIPFVCVQVNGVYFGNNTYSVSKSFGLTSEKSQSRYITKVN